MDRRILLEDDTANLCRICFDNSDQKDLISPCLCAGGSEYVHRKCLDNWRSLNKDGRAFQFCEVCQFNYVIEPIVDDPSAEKKRLLMFYFLVTRDITLIILLIQLIIIGMAFLLGIADKKTHAIKNLYPTFMSSFGIYYLTSIVLCFALLGLFGVIGYCCGLTQNNGRTYNNNYRYSNSSYRHNTVCICTDNTCDSCTDCCTDYSKCCTDCSKCCGDGDFSCDKDNRCDKSAGVILIVIVVIFAIIGVFVGIFLSWKIIKKILDRHTSRLWLKQETKKYIVKDFQGRRDELPNTVNEQSNTQLLTNIVNEQPNTQLLTNNESIILIPSALIQFDNHEVKYSIK